MNKQPVSYLQTDKRWSKKPYQAKGETSTIAISGCGPSCAAMLIETLTGKTYTPEDACNWSMAHGYKAKGHGTYYSYFVPQFAEFGIYCEMLNYQNSYGKPNHANHDKVLRKLQEGWYAIACMGPGAWTKGGHFVVIWWQDGKVRINDPASTKANRLNGDIETFRSEVKYYWLIDARAYNNPEPEKEDEDIMTGEEIYHALNEYTMQQPVPDWAKDELQKAVDAGITDGSNPMVLIPRYQAALMAFRAMNRKEN